MKLVITLFVLGFGITFAELTSGNEKDITVPHDKESSVLKIETYTSDNGKEINEVIKASVEENINEVANIIQELQTERADNVYSDEEIENEQAAIDAKNIVAISAIENENLDAGNYNWNGYHDIDDDYVAMQESDFYYKDLMNSDPNEIMATAAGFVPIPILKRKQKPRRQFAHRRYFRKPYPYRRSYYYYPYHRYYYPGSLRFY